MPTKRIVCLANSRKLSGRCVAGRVFDGHEVGEWVRPVSARQNEEVSEYERQCLTISIGEPYKGNCYKLVAAIIPKE